MALALGSSAHGNGSTAGRESLLDPSHSRERGEPHHRGQDWVNWNPVRPHSGSCRPCLEPVCGQGWGAGQGWWSGRCCQEGSALAPGWDRALPRTTLDSGPSAAHGTTVTGSETRGDVAGSSPGWTGCGVEPLPPLLPGVSCSINEPLCATQHSCPCFGRRRGAPGARAGCANARGWQLGSSRRGCGCRGRAPGQTRPRAGPRVSAARGVELRR